MLRRVADLIVYIMVIFPLNLIEAAVNIQYNSPISYFASQFFVPAMLAIFVLILLGRIGIATLVQALYGVTVTILKGMHQSETYTGGDLLTIMLPMVLLIVIIPVPLMYGFQKLVVERRSAA